MVKLPFKNGGEDFFFFLAATHLDGYEHLVVVGAEVCTLCQVDFAKRSFPQLPLQNNILPFNMLDT